VSHQIIVVKDLKISRRSGDDLKHVGFWHKLFCRYILHKTETDTDKETFTRTEYFKCGYWRELKHEIVSPKEEENIEKKLLTLCEIEIPVGSRWIHRRGEVYVVEAVANLHSQNFSRWPITIVYTGESSKKTWTRPYTDWHRSFSLLENV